MQITKEIFRITGQPAWPSCSGAVDGGFMSGRTIINDTLTELSGSAYATVWLITNWVVVFLFCYTTVFMYSVFLLGSVCWDSSIFISID